LTTLGHEVAVEFDISDAVTIEAVALFQPALVIAPFLKRAVPEAVWRQTVCLVVHPGIVGDRGPSALDWAISEGESEWGVTILQAESQMDAGPVWAAETFAMRDASKSSLYRNEVTEGAARAVVAAVQRFAAIGAAPAADTAQRRGRWRPLMQQADRRIDWQRDDTQTVLRKIRASDGTPGVLDQLFDTPCHLFDAHPELQAAGPPGRVIGRGTRPCCAPRPTARSGSGMCAVPTRRAASNCPRRWHSRPEAQGCPSAPSPSMHPPAHQAGMRSAMSPKAGWAVCTSPSTTAR
jgi:putative two-component system hydrogenase maturation factor HypX/HoxX